MNKKEEIWLIYDGNCPLCTFSAKRMQIKKAIGQLHIINAREIHPIVETIKHEGLDFNQGMVVKFNNTLYQGSEALHFLALIGTHHDWFNRMNVILFKFKWVAKVIYPFLKGLRNLIIYYKTLQKADLNE